MTARIQDAVEHYYDARVAGKLSDFTHPLPRIEVAIETLAQWAPARPRRVLEIGCGVGATSWRMARAWPDAEVIGTDISPTSIEVAQTCFQRPNLRYQKFSTSDGSLDGKFDLIVMMDVYEHVPPGERAALHSAVRSLLSEDSRFILMIPTIEHQAYLREHQPDGLQPVDEDIGLEELAALARETATQLLYYRTVGVWHYGDYFHAVLGRYQSFAPVARRQYRPPAWQAAKQQIKRLLGRRTGTTASLSDYLGPDMLADDHQHTAAKFAVSIAERRRLAAAWLRRATGS